MKALKTFGIASGMIAAALVGGTMISVVWAAPASAPAAGSALAVDAEDTDGARYCAVWQETFADELGVAVEDLVPAAKAASIATVNAAVEAGDLTADIGERIIARIEAGDGNGCRLLGGAFHWAGKHAVRADARHDLMGAAAEALGMEPGAVIEALRGGDTLEEIAVAQGVDYETVSTAIVDAVKADLDALVAADKITQERADTMLDKLTQSLADGTWPPMAGPDGERHGPGFGGFGGRPFGG